MMRLRLLIMVILSLILASCGGDDDNDSGNAGDSGDVNAPAISVSWDRDPSTIVFRAEVVGGEDDDAFYRRNDVPYCTIYGDGQIVWTNETGTGFQILYDHLSDEQIASFASYLITQRAIYDYTAEAAYEISSTAPVAEVLTLNVNDTHHVTDVFGGWDYQYFEEILGNCVRLGRTPTIFEPTEAWISAQATTYDSTVPFQRWSQQATGISLSELAASGERRWISGDLVRAIWRWIYRAVPNMQFGQGDGVYYIGLEVPSVTRFAPPRPQ
jgi:hypothetical protein